MAITPIQPNINNTKPHKHYLDAEGAINTDKNVKPLPPKGHLVHDRLLTMPKYFMKDIAYDMKAVKDGFNGKANDHQTGRLNDVGLKLGGIGIATILASRTSNPLARVMEYAGLGAFLASMSLFPKIAIQAPSRMRHGFDSGIEYIDDQGRKKSVFQDQNYIPFDMYRGEYPSEDLEVIGDRMGIPKNIKNRNDITKEQMRKIAIQNNTLWMLTAGFATPVMTALICSGLEKVISPAMEEARNAKYNFRIGHTLRKTEKMTLNPEEISSNSLSRSVERILRNYKDQEIPQSEFERMIKSISNHLDENTAEGIRQDLTKIIRGENNGYALSQNASEEIIKNIKTNIPEANRTSLEKVFVPTKEELDRIFTSKVVKADDMQNIRGALKNLFDSKIAQETTLDKAYLNAYRNRVVENITKDIQKTPSNYVSESTINDIVKFAKIIGDFKSTDKALDSCKSFKFEYAPETVIARSYNKFEKTLFEVLDINLKDMKQMKESEQFTKEILDKKLTALAKDNVKYEKAIKKLANVMSEMEINLNGKSEETSHIKDLITAIENNYNKTAKRLQNAGYGKFNATIDRLVKGDFSNSLKTRQDLFDLLDGTKAENNLLSGIDAVFENAKGIGSSKNQEISRIVERYQGAKNSFNRILHLADIYHREAPQGGYAKEVFEKGKEAVLTATTSDHMLKLDTINNPTLYKDIMQSTWNVDGLTQETRNALSKHNDLSHGDIGSRFEKYIERFKNVIGNNSIDFTKPRHTLNPSDLNKYTKSSKTRMSNFNLVAQSPVEMMKKSANRKYGTKVWLRRASIIGGSVLLATLLAQLGFGKITNPNNMQKQVSDDDNK